MNRTKTSEDFLRERCSEVEVVCDHASPVVMSGKFRNATACLYRSKECWRKARMHYLGASDVPIVLGLTDNWKTAKELFDEKTGGICESQNSIVGNEAIRIGVESEPHIRELFAIEHPQLDVYDGSNLMFVSDTLPFASASLDGIAFKGDEPIDLEIKCGLYGTQWRQSGFLPDNYFVQLLWQSFVTGITSCYLRARLRYYADDQMDYLDGCTEKVFSYDTEAEDVKPQKLGLVKPCTDFWKMVEAKSYFPSMIRI